MEIWGGIECTINRVGDDYYDQLHFSGHYTRRSDLKQICDLGISRLRYPVLWEKHSPDQNAEIDWRATERNLRYLQQRDVEVIAGLVHHGSGPAYVHMGDDSFSAGLAEYAGKVARQFPWIRYYTPVNEPLTTARFCGLYGLWFPHSSDTLSFLRILMQECKATIMAMEAIRMVNPSAQLIFTEDLGYTHATDHLQYQADFENQRRWLSIDLICGNVTPAHPLWKYMLSSGVQLSELLYFRDHQIFPDLLGCNYYITSERFLDTALELYPAHTHGGNGIDRYADVEAIRTGTAQTYGAENLLRDAWNRYNLPMAITESHMSCGREDQLRWLQNSWNTAVKLQREHIDIRAVTAWSLLGAHGWDQLLTAPPGRYESGVFELRAGKLRATALTEMITGFAAGLSYEHPLLASPGWWERDSRILYGQQQEIRLPDHQYIQPLLLIGGDKRLVDQFYSRCRERGIYGLAIASEEADTDNLKRLAYLILELHPWGIINAYELQYAHTDTEREHQISTKNTSLNLSVLCFNSKIKLLNFSCDYRPEEKINYYFAKDDESQLNLYWTAKSKFDEQLLIFNPYTLIIRPAIILNNLTIGLADCSWYYDIHFDKALNFCIDHMIDDEYGIWYLGEKGMYTWSELARETILHLN
jgi:dTDP-4-dehydrorhamnose reductase